MPIQLIDHPDGGQMLAPLEYPNAHELTLEEIEEHFVTGAPFEPERRELFNTLRTFTQSIWRVLPDSEIWVDGGFCTLKDWAAPKDIDIAIGVPSHEVPMTRDPAIKYQLDSLTTRELPGLPDGENKVKPFGGQIDSFLFPALSAEQREIPLNLGPLEQQYYALWSAVKGKNATVINGMHKGFIKVVKPWSL